MKLQSQYLFIPLKDTKQYARFQCVYFTTVSHNDVLFSVDQETPGNYSAFTDVGQCTPRDRRGATDKEVANKK